VKPTKAEAEAGQTDAAAQAEDEAAARLQEGPEVKATARQHKQTTKKKSAGKQWPREENRSNSRSSER